MLDGENEDMSLDDVAATLLVRPDTKEEKAPVAKVPAQKEETAEETANEDATDEAVDEAIVEEESAEETDNETAEDTQTEDEEDVDVDELDIDVTVDGEEKKVKLKDLKANYSGNGAIEKRLQEASEIRNLAMEQGKKLYTALQIESAKLSKLDEIIAKVAEPDIDWEELKRTNLPKYLLERDKQREAEIRRNALTKEQERIKAEQARLEALAQEQYTMEQAKQLVAKIPDFGDPVKAQAKYAALSKAAAVYGYAPEEVGGVLDHRAMLVLNDALKYQELMNKQAKLQKKPAPATTLLRPSASKAVQPVNQQKKLRDALIKKARATGKPDDVAATLLMRKK